MDQSPAQSLRGGSHQRARGELRVAFLARDGRTVLNGLYQQGCLKALMPRPPLAAWPTMVTLNVSGGVAGGDTLNTAISAGPGAAVTITSQAAERIYRALDEPARVATRLTVNGALEWLPQETILFDGCALDRRIEIAVAPDARFLGAEMLVFGRAAMGETLRTAQVSDRIAIRRGARLVLNDTLRLRGDAEAGLRAMGDGVRAAATIIMAEPDAARHRDGLRASLANGGTAWGASAWDGLLLARMVSDDPARLRERVCAALAVLRDGRPLPRSWQT